MSNLVQDLWNGFVLKETAKVRQRLGLTQNQQQSFNTVPVPANPQAKAQSLQKLPGGFALTQKQMIVGGGFLALGVIGYLAVK